MGTSASNSGPKDKTPLLPSWAQGVSPAATATPAAQPSDATNADGSSSQGPLANSDSAQSGQGQDSDLPAVNTSAATKDNPWQLARRAMTSATKGGGQSYQLQTAGRRYVSAKGGARKAAATASGGRATTARIGSFVSNVASIGFAEATRALGLEGIVGQKVDAVLAAIINAIAPTGTSNDDAIARRAASETIRELFEKYEVQQAGLDALDAMTEADAADSIERSVANYVYQRWLFDLSQRIEQNAVSETDAVKLERDVKDFVTGLVKLKLDGKEAVHLDWKGMQGQKFVQEIYDAAYKLLGGTS
jgi:hypothetical protein